MELGRIWKEATAVWQARHLTLFAKVVVLLSAELILNAFIWIIAVIVFTRESTSQHKILPLALIAWTTGLRHGLDADHISAIDNATRRIVSRPLIDPEVQTRTRRPVTVGLFFSLGHSTIVVATIIAIAVSAGVADGLDSFGDVGSVVGPAVSGSFLILIGCINSYILTQTWKRLRGRTAASEKAHFNGIMTRLAMPLLRSVDRPWKLYPVGVLFGLGFDTASSIALLSVAIIAQNSGEGKKSGNASVVLLAFLFTSGMTLVDSIDSCLMIWAYAPDLTSSGRIRTGFWEPRQGLETEDAVKGRVGYDTDRVDILTMHVATSALDDTTQDDIDTKPGTTSDREAIHTEKTELKDTPCDIETPEFDMEKHDCVRAAEISPPDRSKVDSSKELIHTLDRSASHLSLILTALSIVIAFTVGIIELLGLIGQQCARCNRAADRQEASGNGGLEGRWWITWRHANDDFGYVGAAIVGLFALAVCGYFTIRRVILWRQGKKQVKNADNAHTR